VVFKLFFFHDTISLDGQLLSSLVGVVSEIDFDETMPGSFYDLCASGRK
jgi:hypothetical protein